MGADIMERVLITELKADDIIDLEGDPYADPNHDETTYEFEYVEVVSIKRESDDTFLVAVSAPGDEMVFTCPSDHTVNRVKEMF